MCKRLVAIAIALALAGCCDHRSGGWEADVGARLSGAVYGAQVLPRHHIEGLQISNVNATTPADEVEVAPGRCRDSTDAVDMVVTSTLTLDASTTGANGFDGSGTGSRTGGRWHAIYLIAKPDGTVAALASENFSDRGSDSGFGDDPLLPSGYSYFRLLGSVFNLNITNNYNTFRMTGKGRRRTIWYVDPTQTELKVMSAQAGVVSWTNFAGFQVLTPPGVEGVYCAMGINPNAAGSAFLIRPDAITGAQHQALVSGGVAGQVQWVQPVLIAPDPVNRMIEYQSSSVSDALYLYGTGHIEEL